MQGAGRGTPRRRQKTQGHQGQKGQGGRGGVSLFCFSSFAVAAFVIACLLVIVWAFGVFERIVVGVCGVCGLWLDVFFVLYF